MADLLRDRLQSSLGAAYTLERELGGGGMSRVFVAEERRFGRRVVIKVLPPELAAELSAERFEREIALAAQLQQANIVPLLTAGDVGGLPWYSMPYVEGESLRARLGRGPAALGEVLRTLGDVARALAYAHRQGVVHRDIKPDNVLLSGGTAVVTDFGIAKAVRAARTHAAPASTAGALTGLGSAVGTPAYMAPEQAAADPGADHRLDVYAFGCLAYELLTGVTPFHGLPPQKLLAAHMSERPRPVRELRPDVPHALAELVARCLEKDPDARPASAEALVGALDGISTSGPVPATPPGGPAAFRRALVLYAAAFAAVAVLARTAIVGLGLPDWVLPGALGVMTLGLPVLLFTGYTQRVVRHAAAAPPAYVPNGSPATARHGTVARLALRASRHLSWRRTLRGNALALGAFAAGVAAFMAMRALGIGPVGSLFASGALRQQDRILVADFRAPAADSSLGGVVSDAVRTSLAQSRAIGVVRAGFLAAALQRMQKPATTRVDLALAREIAQREGIKAVVDGRVSGVGSGFLVQARLVAAETGDELTSVTEGARDASELIPAIDRVTRRVREKLGESLKTVRAAPPLVQVTTASLPALRKFTEAYRANYAEGDYPKAFVLAEQAVRLDTGFAMGYVLASRAARNAGYAVARRDSLIRMALARRDRLPERERLQVEAAFHGSPTTGDRAKALATWERAIALDPNDATMWHNAALILISRREYARAEAYDTRALAAGGTAATYVTLAGSQISQGKLDAAARTLDSLQARVPAVPALPLSQAALWAARGRIDSAAAACARATRTSDALSRANGLRCRASVAVYQGRLAAHLRMRAEWVALTTGRTGERLPYESAMDSSRVDAWFRDRPQQAAQRLDEALARQPLASLPISDRPYLALGRAYAVAGRPDRAGAMLAQYDADQRDTAQRRVDRAERDAVAGEIALAERRYDAAIDLFRRADVSYDGRPTDCALCMLPPLARAYDLAGKPDSAVAISERYLRSTWALRWTATVDGLYLAATYKRLGELHEARGDRARAADYYAKFVDVWKDADPDLQPRVRDVRQRLGRLNARGG